MLIDVGDSVSENHGGCDSTRRI